MEGFDYLFRVPNATTRKRILAQLLWQLEGQTMFVAKWEPGLVPMKLELTSAPIWVELRNVPFLYFTPEGFEHIAGLFGHPLYLHPATANMTNPAKVFTIITHEKPLPEGVDVRFESGEIQRVVVSSPLMPSVCSHCVTL